MKKNISIENVIEYLESLIDIKEYYQTDYNLKTSSKNLLSIMKTSPNNFFINRHYHINDLSSYVDTSCDVSLIIQVSEFLDKKDKFKKEYLVLFSYDNSPVLMKKDKISIFYRDNNKLYFQVESHLVYLDFHKNEKEYIDYLKEIGF